jgi:hypothetical protein
MAFNFQPTQGQIAPSKRLALSHRYITIAWSEKSISQESRGPIKTVKKTKENRNRRGRGSLQSSKKRRNRGSFHNSKIHESFAASLKKQ